MTDLLSHALLVLSNLLLVPVIVLLMGFSALVVMHAGGLAAESWERARHGGAWRTMVRRLKDDPAATPAPGELPEDAGAGGRAAMPGLVGDALRELRRAPASLDKVLDDLELDAERRLSRLQLGLRLGPMLGLAGTLIPLGPALDGLAEGDLQALASQLVVAFATPVLGLLIGGGCFAMRNVRRRWYAQDISDVDFVARRMVRA